MAYVNIVTSDSGWILERLAREIDSRVPYVKYSSQVDRSAAIQYYITYSRRRQRVSPIEVAYFAHMELDEKTKKRFFEVAGSVEHCVCHSKLYAESLREAGVENVTTISPGVDLDCFVPKVKIGVIGRTYHTGRKGERLVAKVQDVPGIEWFFTGEGWPGPALKIPAERLPEFYRSLDYILVPALYEGGPMCVIEALACGKPVIAPPIGWVSEFPHIEYEAGNAADLRRVLEEVAAERHRLRESVLDRTWDAWAEGHDRLFSSLLHEARLTAHVSVAALSEAKRPLSAQLILHGSEGASLGGPTVRVPRTAAELREIGLAAQAVRFPDAEFGKADILHGFNIWSPKTSLAVARRARWLDKPYVFSPIFLDLSERQLWQDDLLAIFESHADPEHIDRVIADLLARHRIEATLRHSLFEPIPGYHALAREAVDAADHVIFLSEHEKSLFERLAIRPRRSTIVRNPVDAASFGTGDPNLFRDEFGLNDYVLCVARVEPRKNQLMLVHALRETGLPVVLVGHTSSRRYGDLIRRHGGDRVRMIDRLEPGSDMLKSAFAGARVLALPSWAEGAPLVALEGGAAGASMVLSSRSGEKEYFGKRARYCDPADAGAIRDAVLEAYESKWDDADREGLKAHVAEHFNWERYARETLDVYCQTFADFAGRDRTTRRRSLGLPQLPAGRRTQIVVDVTTSANHSGRWTGIARVEMALTHALAACPDAELLIVAWADSVQRFIAIPLEAVVPEQLGLYLSHSARRGGGEFRFIPGSAFVVAGSAWMQNPRYAEAITRFAAEHELMLTPILHDLVPIHFPFWFNDGYAPIFERNLTVVLSAAARLLSVSDNTRRDVQAFAARRDLYIPEIQVIRPGDTIEIPGIPLVDLDEEKLAQIQALIGAAPFALSVGAIHTRKNHKLLYDVWVRLAETLGNKCPHLVLVGGVAWNGQEMARLLRQDARVKNVVHILEDVDDAALSWLYANCIFTVYPSLYEGWGLPVGESLRFGKICIASTISSVPEIAPELTDLIDPLDFAAWYTRVLFYAGSASAREQREEEIRTAYRRSDWHDAARQLLELVRAPVDFGGAPNLYTPGTLVRLGELDTAILYKTFSWFATESWGAWSSGARAGLRLVLAEPTTGPYLLTVRARALVPSDSTFSCGVTLNGHPIGRLRFSNGNPRTFTLMVPSELIGADRAASIVIENDRVQRIADLTRAKNDDRSVGIGVEFAVLSDIGFRTEALTYVDDRERELARQFVGRWTALRSAAERNEILRGEWNQTSWGWIGASGRSSLSLTVHEDPESDLIVECRVRGAATAASNQSVLVLANGVPVARWNFSDDSIAFREIRIPAAVRFKQQPVTVEFAAREERSPATLRIGSEARDLVFGLFELRYGTTRLFEQRERAWRLTAPIYELGKTISITSSPSADQVPALPYLKEGWLPAESSGTWALGERGSLCFRLAAPLGAGMLFDIELRSFGTAKLGPTSATVKINGHRAFEVELLTDDVFSTTHFLPAELVPGEQYLEIEVTSARVSSPFSLGLNKDDRLLGTRLSSMRLRPVASFALGEGFDLSRPEVADAVLARDWYRPEREGAWSGGQVGTIYVRVPADIDLASVSGGRKPGRRRGRTAESVVRLLVVLRVVQATEEAPVPVRVVINGEPCGEVIVTRPASELVNLPVPIDLVRPGSVMKIELHQPLAASPKALGLGDETRVLGVMVSAFAFALAGEAAEAAAMATGIGAAAEWAAGEFEYDDAALPESGDAGDAEATPAYGAEPGGKSTFEVPGEQPEGPNDGASRATELLPQAATIFLAFGEILSLRADAPFVPTLGGGMYDVEPEGIWTDGSPAVISIRIPDLPDGGVRVSVVARVYGTAYAGPATVYARAGAGPATAWIHETDEFQTDELLILPDALDQTGRIEIVLERPGATSPAETEGAADTRRLGVKIQQLVVNPVERPMRLAAVQEEAAASYDVIYGEPEAEAPEGMVSITAEAEVGTVPYLDGVPLVEETTGDAAADGPIETDRVVPQSTAQDAEVPEDDQHSGGAGGRSNGDTKPWDRDESGDEIAQSIPEPIDRSAWVSGWTERIQGAAAESVGGGARASSLGDVIAGTGPSSLGGGASAPGGDGIASGG